jgi:hypothetical protein
MPASITSAEIGSRKTVTGSRMATPVVPPTPGMTPTSRPRITPSIMKPSRRRGHQRLHSDHEQIEGFHRAGVP